METSAPVPALALIGGFHEGVELERFLRRDGHFAGAEHIDDLGEQHVVAVVRADDASPFSPMALPP